MIRAFPVAKAFNYRDNFGEPRRGPPPHAHQGIDIYAPRGTDVLAVDDGTVKFADGGLGGTAINLMTNDGERVYYAHLDARYVSDGTFVKARDRIAAVGDSGNALGGPTHVHFEEHPGNGPAVNPYAALQAAEKQLATNPPTEPVTEGYGSMVAAAFVVLGLAYVFVDVVVPRLQKRGALGRRHPSM